MVKDTTYSTVRANATIPSVASPQSFATTARFCYFSFQNRGAMRSRKQPSTRRTHEGTTQRKRRAVATRSAYRRGASDYSSSSSSSSSSSDEEYRGVTKKQRREEGGDIEILQECALIDAVCAAANEASAQTQRAVGNRPARKRSPARVVPTKNERQRGGKLVLCEVGERLMMSFLPALPGRLKVASVCKRWRRMSLQEVALRELDFDKVVLRSVTKKDVLQILQRANGELRRLVVPDMRLDDAIVQCIASHTHLQLFRAHRYCVCNSFVCVFADTK